MVLRVALDRPARFLAKATLFKNPLGRLAMDAFGSIPIHRAQDRNPDRVPSLPRRDSAGRAVRPPREESGARAGDASRNDESFGRCRAELTAGGALALFPEGVSHSDSQLRPLKTGAARIALSAEAENDGRLGVTVVPVGLYYGRKSRFRSSVVLAVGEPIDVAPLLPDYRNDERSAVAALTERIDAGLDEVVLQAESRELLEGIARVARWMSSPDAGDDPAAQHRRARELAAAYSKLRARDPHRVEAIAAEVRAYTRTLRRLGIRDPWALEVHAPKAGAALTAMIRLIVAAPFAVIGVVMGWLPYRFAGEVAARVSRDDDILGTVKLVAGTTFLAAAWAAEAFVAGWLWGAVWVLPVFLLGVASGYIALRFEELLREAAEAWRNLTLRAFHFQTALRLTERRRALADDVARALVDAA